MRIIYQEYQLMTEYLRSNPTQYLNNLGISGCKIKGKQVLARCPFHNDKRPSFSINTENGLWKCYSGCGHGNLYQLLERTLNL